MESIPWSSELELGHAQIDSQHRRMVEIFNILHAAVRENRAGEAENRLLDELVGLAEENFRTEEWLMQAGSGSSAEQEERFCAHREAHEHLLHEISELRDELFARHATLNLKTLRFLKRWLFEHVKGADRHLLELTGRTTA
jgi:hemerythrin-like metal-binding protein